MKSIFKVVAAIIISTFLFGCKTSTEPEKPKELIPYISLNVGDIRQYYAETEGVYFQWRVLDTTKRVDGQKVFKLEELMFLPEGYYKAILYYFIKDNFYFATNLDTVSNDPLKRMNKLNGNKFNEQRLAEVYPKNGDYFLRNEVIADSEKVFFKVSIIDSMTINCGKFKNVAQYETINTDTSSWKLWIYYAPESGHIGSIIENNNGKQKISATYMKVNGKEIGKYTQLNSGKLISNPNQKFESIFHFLKY